MLELILFFGQVPAPVPIPILIEKPTDWPTLLGLALTFGIGLLAAYNAYKAREAAKEAVKKAEEGSVKTEAVVVKLDDVEKITVSNHQLANSRSDQQEAKSKAMLERQEELLKLVSDLQGAALARASRDEGLAMARQHSATSAPTVDATPNGGHEGVIANTQGGKEITAGTVKIPIEGQKVVGEIQGVVIAPKKKP